MPPEAESKGYQCPSCSRHFGRAEHLRRHALVHSESRPYRCQFCPKDFVRRDALTRHILTHQAPPSLLQRGGRACLSCQRAKARCSGDQRCSRCLNRDIQCEYPASDSPSSETDVTPDHRLSGQIDLGCDAVQSQTTSNTSSIRSEGFHDIGSTASGKAHLEIPIQRPYSKRRKTSTTTNPIEGSPTPTSSSSSLNVSDQPGTSWNSNSALSLAVFEEIASLYRRLCVWPPAPWNAFKQVNLPDMATLSHFLHLYYLHFDPTLPFWHAAWFKKVEQHPVLIVAMTAIGSCYAEGANLVRTSLLEFGRRSLIFVKENTADSRLDSIPVCAAQLLQIVGMAYCEHENFHRQALDCKRELAQILELCQREWTRCSKASTEPDDDTAWASWCHREGLLRLASSTWLVDCMLAYHFESWPSLRLRDMRYPLPCAERVWSASTAQEWRSLRADCTSQPSLGKAMQELYVDKRLSQERGEFARIIIIHGLYQRTWEVQRYFENPLSSWDPSVTPQSSTELLPKAPVYLPSIPEVRSWQSAACDALTLMHWQAKAQIGRESGHEHPTVLHLHIARIVLLTPYVQIIHLARTSSGGGEANLEDESTADSKQILQRWVGHHQRLARIATVHAGLIFWHIRRASLKGFYEAHSVALAALVLWAFGTFSSEILFPVSEQNDHDSASHEDSEQSDDVMCEIILIDRPTDEELVQQFIQNGRSMRIHMTGVENLYGPRGPESVLVQGCKLLSSLKWGASSSWYQMLHSLADVSRKRRESKER